MNFNFFATAPNPGTLTNYITITTNCLYDPLLTSGSVRATGWDIFASMYDSFRVWAYQVFFRVEVDYGATTAPYGLPYLIVRPGSTGLTALTNTATAYTWDMSKRYYGRLVAGNYVSGYRYVITGKFHGRVRDAFRMTTVEYATDADVVGDYQAPADPTLAFGLNFQYRDTKIDAGAASTGEWNMRCFVTYYVESFDPRSWVNA